MPWDFRRRAGAGRSDPQVGRRLLTGRGRQLMEANFKNYHMPLSKREKLAVEAWLIVSDYAQERFPPTFKDQQRAYQGEGDCYATVPVSTRGGEIDNHILKPFEVRGGEPQTTTQFARLLHMARSLRHLLGI